MTVDMKTLAKEQIEKIVSASKEYKEGTLDFQGANAVFLENRELCRVIGLRNKIAENAKKSPSKDLLEYAGIE